MIKRTIARFVIVSLEAVEEQWPWVGFRHVALLFLFSVGLIGTLILRALIS